MKEGRFDFTQKQTITKVSEEELLRESIRRKRAEAQAKGGDVIFTLAESRLIERDREEADDNPWKR